MQRKLPCPSFSFLILPKSDLLSHLLLHSIHNNYLLLDLILKAVIWGRCHFPYFSIEEIESQQLISTCQRDRQKGNQRDLKSGKDSAYHLWLWRWMAPSLGRWAQPQETEINPWSRAGKEMGILVLQPQGPDFTPGASRGKKLILSALWDT